MKSLISSLATTGLVALALGLASPLAAEDGATEMALPTSVTYEHLTANADGTIPGVPNERPKDPFSDGWKGKFEWASADGHFSFRFRLWLMVDIAGGFATDDYRSAYLSYLSREPDPANPGQLRIANTAPGDLNLIENVVGFREARIGINGKLFNDVYYAFQVGIMDGLLRFEDIWFGVELFGDAKVGRFFAGHFREDIGLESLQAIGDIMLLQRNMFHRAFVPFRNIGAHYANSELFDGRLHYAIGVWWESNLEGVLGGDQGDVLLNDPPAITGRVTGLLLDSDDDRTLLHVGAAASWRTPNNRGSAQGAFSYNADPDIRFAHPTMTVNRDPNAQHEIQADNALIVGGELLLHLGPFSVMGEHMSNFVMFNGTTSHLNGQYVQVSFFPTMEQRTYSNFFARALGVVPNQDALGGGGPGAWEIVLRYNRLDFTAVGEGQLHTGTLGVNWWMNRNTRLMANVSVPIGDDPNVPGIQAVYFGSRLQINF